MSTQPEKVALHESSSLPPNYDESKSAACVQHPLAYAQAQNVGPFQPYPAQGRGPGPPQSYSGPPQPYSGPPQQHAALGDGYGPTQSSGPAQSYTVGRPGFPQPYGGPSQSYTSQTDGHQSYSGPSQSYTTQGGGHQPYSGPSQSYTTQGGGHQPYSGPSQYYTVLAGVPGQPQLYGEPIGPSQPFLIQGSGPTQPYMVQTYVQPHVRGQPMQTYGQPQTSIQMTNIGQPTSFQIVQQNDTEIKCTKQLNKVSAILAVVLFGITVFGMIIGPAVASLWDYRWMVPTTSIVGGVGLFLLLIGMVLSFVVWLGKEGNKRGMLIGAIVMYCLALCILIPWAVLGSFFGSWMYAFLVVGFGCLALAILSGIACSRYSDNMIIVLGNTPQPNVIGSAPQPLMGNVGQSVGMGNMDSQCMDMGNVAQPLVMGNIAGQPIVHG